MIRAINLILLGLFLSGLASASSRTYQKSLKSKSIESVKISNIQGNIKVTSKGDDELEVKAFILDDTNKNCLIEFESKNFNLEFYLKKDEKFFSRFKCKVNWEVSLPSGKNLIINNGDGDLFIDGKFLSIDVNTGNGKIEAKNAEAKRLSVKSANSNVVVGKILDNLEIRTGNSDVVVKSLTGDLNIYAANTNLKVNNFSGNVTGSIGNGDVEIVYPSVPKKKSISIVGGIGNVLVKVPDRAKIKLNKVGFGKTQSELNFSEDGDLVLDLKYGSCNLTIKKSISTI